MEELNNIQETIKLTPSLKSEIISSLKYGKIIAVVGFVSVFCMIVMGITTLIASKTTLSEFEDMQLANSISRGVSVFSAVFMFVFSAVVCWLCSLIFVGCKKLDSAITLDKQENYIEGMHKIRIFVQVSAIFSIIGVFFSFISTMITFATIL